MRVQVLLAALVIAMLPLASAQIPTLLDAPDISGQPPAACQADAKSSACAVARACMTDTRAPSCIAGLRDEAFRSAQWSVTNATSIALTQVSARFQAARPELVSLVKLREEDAAKARQLESALLEAIGQGAGAEQVQFRQELTEVRERVSASDAVLDAEFPEYQDLARPSPISLSEAQAWLEPNETLVFYFIGDKSVYIWAISKTEVAWRRAPDGIGEAQVTQAIKALRAALDPTSGCIRGAGQPTIAPVETIAAFDFAASHRLYEWLIKPIEREVAGRNLLIAASGPLMSLPFSTLAPETGNEDPTALTTFKTTRWLGVTNPITILPAPASLRVSRCPRKTISGTCQRRELQATTLAPMIGFGAPVFAGNATAARASETCRGSPGVYSNGTVDQAQIEGLTQLDGTRRELEAMAAVLRADASAVKTGLSATEAAIKEAKLAANVVVFATHGLLANQAGATMESGLAFTPPRLQQPARAADSMDDGYLSATEAAQLDIRAHWVILSACNTALGNKQGAEGLSGLARAFFFAGAETLLVSQWPVYDDAAASLTAGAVQKVTEKVTTDRADALRLSMKEMLDQAGGARPARQAHPSYWAPFMVVGA